MQNLILFRRTLYKVRFDAPFISYVFNSALAGSEGREAEILPSVLTSAQMLKALDFRCTVQLSEIVDVIKEFPKHEMFALCTDLFPVGTFSPVASGTSLLLKHIPIEQFAASI